MQCFKHTAHLENARLNLRKIGSPQQGDHTASLPGTVVTQSRHSGSTGISRHVPSQEGPDWNDRPYGHLQ